MKKILSILLCGCLLLGFAACGESPAVDEEEEATVLQVSAFLSKEDVRSATGIAVGDPDDSMDGSVGYFSADTTDAVYVAVQAVSTAEFEEMLSSLTSVYTLTDAPNLGEKAVWCEELVYLLVYANGMAYDVRVEYAQPHPNNSLLAARQIAALLLERV